MQQPTTFCIPDTSSAETGYTLMELLVSLLLVALMTLAISQYLLASQQLQQQLQQQALAGRLALDLAAQLQSPTLNSTQLAAALSPSRCPATAQGSPDLTLWCEASARLPDLRASISGSGSARQLTLQWQGPHRQQQLQRWLQL
ncbi:hypothetical protein [Marinospirillum alkaliphilum]|uniref:Type IV pilus assembly protein PilV n=1 Tax=Marinospirillum alkaliphilum DSM 21637 TaxID=1122209 RepID=A0A1K1XYT6_9GAMM|nr:hypothetical protein [Marinospirillum alkaliphilum]SFX54945.1 hypothetical protein SAMN02745752_02038 [Marinospirillum alkaliphilum DSM 21637]